MKSTALQYLRSHITPQNRELLQLVALLGVAGIGIPAQESGSLDQAITSVVLTGVVLLLAIINSSPRMAAVYAFLGAVGGVAQILAVQHAGSAWAGYLGLAAVILAKVIAALRAPSPVIVNGSVELGQSVELESVQAALPLMIRQQLKDVVDDAIHSTFDAVQSVTVSNDRPGQHRSRT